jgi:MYXO-CTERM domain-containing protein
MNRAAIRTLAIVLTTTSLSGVSWASGNYPAVVQDELKLTATPDCAACHQGAPTSGTANTAFATALKSRGMTGGGNEAALRTALQALVAEKNPEIDKIKGGGAVSGPEYGCSVGGAGAGNALLVGLALLGVVARGRRRR